MLAAAAACCRKRLPLLPLPVLVHSHLVGTLWLSDATRSIVLLYQWNLYSRSGAVHLCYLVSVYIVSVPCLSIPCPASCRPVVDQGFRLL